MNNIQNCNCKIAPILRYINNEVFENNTCINLNNFENIDVPLLTSCLNKHGFTGYITCIDKDLHYVHTQS